MLDAIRNTITASKTKLIEARAMMTQQHGNDGSGSNVDSNVGVNSNVSAIVNSGIVDNNINNNNSNNNNATSSLQTIANNNIVGSSQLSGQSDYKALTYKEVFYLSTMGGANVLRMDNVLGNFKIGKKLDCLGTPMLIQMIYR